jgi:UDP-GlcNAc:undecaprenyl-phosphate/decaprenyl-phosphate GlcNAc-1-phosphate transferase
MTRMRALPRLLAAASGTRLAYAALTGLRPEGEKTWTRTNHRGEPVTLLEGPAVTVAAVAAALAVPGLDARSRLALSLAAAGAGAFGCYDDLAGGDDRRGFRGHLGAIARGEITTGAVKIAGIGAAGLAAGILLDRRDRALGAASPASRSSSASGRLADVVINAGLVAGGANLINLFDLRPGRAIKVSLLSSLALGLGGQQCRAATAAPAGAAAAMLPEDLGERAMLGDCGANAIGAMLGVAAASLPRPARVLGLGAVAALTAASEKISFTQVIARTPALNWLDMLGRRPVEPAAARARSQRWPVHPDGAIPLNGELGQSSAAAETTRPL